jgi:hypothetical protein
VGAGAAIATGMFLVSVVNAGAFANLEFDNLDFELSVELVLRKSLLPVSGLFTGVSSLIGSLAGSLETDFVISLDAGFVTSLGAGFVGSTVSSALWVIVSDFRFLVGGLTVVLIACLTLSDEVDDTVDVVDGLDFFINVTVALDLPDWSSGATSTFIASTDLPTLVDGFS